jgi:hypothetical protein
MQLIADAFNEACCDFDEEQHARMLRDFRLQAPPSPSGLGGALDDGVGHQRFLN